MANRYWVGGTANWDATAGTKWALTSGGVGGQAVPTSSDDVFFDAASGAVTVTSTVGVSCLSINFTGFTGTFAGSTTFHIGGNVTLGSGMTSSFTGNFSIEVATATLRSNGISWLGNINLAITSGVYTLFDNWTVASLSSGGANAILNGNSLNVLGSITMTQNMASGTTNINLTGTGTWSGSGQLKNNLTIKSTAIIDIIGNVQFNTGTFIVESGAQVNASNSGLAVQANATTTFDISTVKLNNFSLGGSSTVNTLQLNSPLYITGTAFLGASNQQQTINGSPIYIESGVLNSGVINNGGGDILGTSQIIMTGETASIIDLSLPSFPSANSLFRIPITVDVRSTILMTGRFRLGNGGSFAILNGNVVNLNSRTNVPTLTITNSTTLTNIDKCKFKNITVTAGVTITMNKFFSGSPEFKTVIRSTTAANYIITFTDSVPKKAYFVNVKNCTINQTLVKNQLNIIGRDSNSGLNNGIIFGEAGLNGFPLNQYGTDNSYSFTDGFSQGGMNN